LSDLNDEEFIESHLASAEDLEPYCFPELSTLSPAFFYQFVPVAKTPQTPEVVFVPTDKVKPLELVGVLANWNWLWEASQYRKEAFSESRFKTELPDLAEWIDKLPDANTYLIADSETRYDAYAPLYHLVPKRLLDRYQLPALKRPLWPNNAARWPSFAPARIEVSRRSGCGRA
jgi:hypothetical protein